MMIRNNQTWARLTARLTAGFALALAVLALGAGIVGRILPPGDEMAYMSRGDLRWWDIYLMDVPRGLVHRMTRDAGNNRFPAWSPDGRRLVFHSDRGNPYYELYIMDVDGRNLRRITGANMEVYRRAVDFAGILGNAMAAWSPDGQWIGFHSDVGGSWDLYLVDPNGEQVIRLTQSPENEIFISWSPDGTQLLFSSSSPSETFIYLMNTDGTERRQITSRDTYFPGVPTPDGGVRPSQPLAPHELFATATAMAPRSSLPPLATPLPPPAVDYHPEWSPDGERFVFQASRGRPTDDIYVMELASGVVTRLTDSFNMNRNAAWLRDGERISFTSDRDLTAQIYIIGINGGGLRRLTTLDRENDAASWRP